MKKFSFHITDKLVIGLLFILVSVVLGNVTKLTLLLYLTDPLIRWASIIIYIFTWPMLIIGIWLTGREYFDQIKKYFTYRYYHESVKKRARKAYHGTKKRLKRKK